MITVEIKALQIKAEFPMRNMAERFIDWVQQNAYTDRFVVEVTIGNETEERVIC